MRRYLEVRNNKNGVSRLVYIIHALIVAIAQLHEVQRHVLNAHQILPFSLPKGDFDDKPGQIEMSVPAGTTVVYLNKPVKLF
jgi:hypothetical protein